MKKILLVLTLVCVVMFPLLSSADGGLYSVIDIGIGTYTEFNGVATSVTPISAGILVGYKFVDLIGLELGAYYNSYGTYSTSTTSETMNGVDVKTGILIQPSFLDDLLLPYIGGGASLSTLSRYKVSSGFNLDIIENFGIGMHVGYGYYGKAGLMFGFQDFLINLGIEYSGRIWENDRSNIFSAIFGVGYEF